MTVFQDLDATALAAEIRAGRLSAEEAVLASIERIEQLDPALNAVVAVRFDEALAEVDAGLPDGPLTGVPTLVKSLGADVAGLPPPAAPGCGPTTCSTPTPSWSAATGGRAWWCSA
ncbi:hypothetical protein ABGB12_11775 [Actinocorallia sp. B10E7]|uniref:hypothetical protein n=1 Tax=Actinocorallia sp. B10E7 TaxID=3153558 RepID=UPI00325C8854